jgi:muconate cycloisomerase
MKITHVEKWQVLVPTREEVFESEGRFAPPGPLWFTAPKWIIRVHSDDGLQGIGESWRGESEESIDSAISAIVGTDPRRLALHALPLPDRSSYTTIEMALFDLMGKYWEVPAYQLLGGAQQERVAIASWAYRHSAERLARIAKEARQAGFRSIKFKATFADPPALLNEGRVAQIVEDDPVVESVRAIAAGCGPDFAITIDANCRFYEFERAIGVARALEGCAVVLEDPISWQTDLDAYPRLCRESPVRIAIHIASLEAVTANVAEGALGYAVHSSSSALLLEVIKRHAADCVNLGGSMTEFVKLAWLAGEAGMPCWHESGLDLGIRDASYVQASFAAPNCTIPGDMIGNVLRVDDLIEEPIPIENGYVERSVAPGLGVTLDERALDTYRVKRPG